MKKKYEIMQNRVKVVDGHYICPIRALKKFKTVTGDIINPGDIGGYIEDERSLSQGGNCWVSPGGCILGDARVAGDAYIIRSMVRNDAVVYGAAVIRSSVVQHRATVCGNASINGSVIEGWTTVKGNTEIRMCSQIEGDTHIGSETCVYNSLVGSNANISGKTAVVGAYVVGNVTLTGTTTVDPATEVCGDGIIKNGFILPNRSSAEKVINYWTDDVLETLGAFAQNFMDK